MIMKDKLISNQHNFLNTTEHQVNVWMNKRQKPMKNTPNSILSTMLSICSTLDLCYGRRMRNLPNGRERSIKSSLEINILCNQHNWNFRSMNSVSSSSTQEKYQQPSSFYTSVDNKVRKKNLTSKNWFAKP